VRVSPLIEFLPLWLGIQAVVVSKELEPFLALAWKVAPSLKEFSKASPVVMA
jgi:hypothetical protein